MRRNNTECDGGVVDIERFYTELGDLFASGKIEDVDPFLQRGLAQAEAEGDDGAAIGVLNEMIGRRRSVGDFSEAIRAAEKALALMRKLGLENSVDYGTTLLNAATAYKASGDKAQALELFSQALEVYRAGLPEGDPRIAGLYNNMSAVHLDAGEYEKAGELLEKSVAILTGAKGAETELATAYANLAQTLFLRKREEDAARTLQRAMEAFEPKEGDRRSPHYAAALAVFAGAHFAVKRYGKALELYEETLTILHAAYGENKDYAVTCGNAAVVCDAMGLTDKAAAFRAKAEGKTPAPVSADSVSRGPTLGGLELSRAYYDAHGKQMIRKLFPELYGRAAVGLAGEGSECFGFDDEISQDHDFGPSFCLWLTRDDYDRFGDALQKAYAELPRSFMGRAARAESEYGAGRVGALASDDFFRKHIGRSDADFSLTEWLRVPESGLAAAVNGAVFHDPLGEFTRVRETLLRYFPTDVRLKKMAARAAFMAQSGQYNYPRCMSRGEVVAAFFALAEFARHACAMVFLLNKKYAPFYKWTRRAMANLPIANDVAYLLDELALEGLRPEKWRFAAPRDMMKRQNTTDKNVVVVERVCEIIVDALREEGATDSRDDFLMSHASRIAARISDETLRSLPTAIAMEG